MMFKIGDVVYVKNGYNKGAIGLVLVPNAGMDRSTKILILSRGVRVIRRRSSPIAFARDDRLEKVA